MHNNLKIIMIDHFDSFTYNLVDIFRKMNIGVEVFRPDVNINRILNNLESQSFNPVLVLSPGPGTPEQADLSINLVKQFYKQIPILGVCLGHQIIAHALGGEVMTNQEPSHGKSVVISHDQTGLFYKLPARIHVGRYHSLTVNRIPKSLKINAKYHSEVMAFTHKTLPIYGVQFHPESILTPDGDLMLKNFIGLCNRHYSLGELNEHRALQ